MNKQFLQSTFAIVLLTGMHFASGFDAALEQSAFLEQMMLTDMQPWQEPEYCPERPLSMDAQLAESGTQIKTAALAQLTADLQGKSQHSTLPSLPALQIGALSLQSNTGLTGHTAKQRRPLLDLNFLHFSLPR